MGFLLSDQHWGVFLLGEALKLTKSGHLASSILKAMVRQSNLLQVPLPFHGFDTIIQAATRNFDTTLVATRNTATDGARCKLNCTRDSRVANSIKLQVHQTDCIRQQFVMCWDQAPKTPLPLVPPLSHRCSIHYTYSA